jgi:hypothetical protein
MFLISIGFVAVFVLAFLLAGRVGAWRNSAVQGALAGLIGFAVLLVAYVTLLGLWARAQFRAFVETQLPLIMERLLQIADQIGPVREAI